VNTYGVPIFKEVNPALFTIVTFPFLFGIMFGDIMHGIILMSISILLCFSERKPGTLMGQMGSMRYLFLLMGFFSTYCGFIYNDMSSVPLKVFGESCYELKGKEMV
jgi:V-type H+-transporting ATPase subunit a